MEGTYPVLLGQEPVGRAEVTRQGLYYHFSCRCRLDSREVCAITVTSGEKCENLGVLAPEGEEYTLKTRLSVKKLADAAPVFRVVPRHGGQDGSFVPLDPEAPFAYISRLQTSCLENRNGILGIVIPDYP